MSEPARLAEHAAVTTHVDDGLKSFARQFASRPRLAALLRALLAPVQATEAEVWALYALGIGESSGHALDQLGAVLGQSRPAGLSDSAYRSVLRAVVKTLHSSGTGPELLAVMRELVGSWGFEMLEAHPASLVFTPDAEPDVPAGVMLGVLSRAASAGVRLQVVDVFDDANRFRFSSSTEEPVDDSDNGFGDESGAPPGGALVGVVST